MKKFLISVMFLLPSCFVQAQDNFTYCRAANALIMSGIQARVQNLPLIFLTKANSSSKGIMLENADKISSDAVKVIVKNISVGWHLLDDYLKDHDMPEGELNSEYWLIRMNQACELELVNI